MSLSYGINNHEHFGRSHNFRPSYMRLKASLLRDKLKAQCILAMTATATTKALSHVMHALDIPSTNLIQVVKPRDNLQLSVSSSENRQVLYNLFPLPNWITSKNINEATKITQLVSGWKIWWPCWSLPPFQRLKALSFTANFRCCLLFVCYAVIWRFFFCNCITWAT